MKMTIEVEISENVMEYQSMEVLSQSIKALIIDEVWSFSKPGVSTEEVMDNVEIEFDF